MKTEMEKVTSLMSSPRLTSHPGTSSYGPLRRFSSLPPGLLLPRDKEDLAAANCRPGELGMPHRLSGRSPARLSCTRICPWTIGRLHLVNRGASVILGKQTCTWALRPEQEGPGQTVMWRLKQPKSIDSSSGAAQKECAALQRCLLLRILRRLQAERHHRSGAQRGLLALVWSSIQDKLSFQGS